VPSILLFIGLFVHSFSSAFKHDHTIPFQPVTLQQTDNTFYSQSVASHFNLI